MPGSVYSSQQPAFRGGGSTPPADLETTFADNFNGVTDGTALYLVPGWAAYNSTGAADANRARLYVQTGVVNHTGTSGGNAYLIAHDFGGVVTGGYMKYTIAAASFAGNLSLAFCSVDEANCLRLRWVSASSVILEKIQAGVSTTLTNPTSTTYLQNDIIEVFCYDRTVTVWRNGQPVAALSNINIDSPGTAFTKGTRYGATTTGNSSAGLKFDNFEARTQQASITITNPSEVYYVSDYTGDPQVPANYTGRLIAFAGTYAGTAPTAVQFRVVDGDSPASVVLQDWTDAAVGTTTIGAGVWSASCRILTLTNHGYVQVRMRSNISIWNTCTTQIGVGGVDGVWGQSNAGGYMGQGSADAALSPLINNKCFVYDFPLEAVRTRKWNKNDNRMPAMLHARRRSDEMGMCWGVIGGGLSARHVGDLWSGTTSVSSDVYTTFTASIAATTLTVTVAGTDPLVAGDVITDSIPNVASGTTILPFGTGGTTGTGGTGTYAVSISQTVSSRSMTVVRNNWTLFTNVLTRGGAVGRMSSFQIIQGEAEGDDTFAFDQNDWASKWSTTIGAVKSQFGSSDMWAFYGLTYRSTGSTSSQIDANWSAIRLLQRNQQDLPNKIGLSHHGIGNALADTIHFGSGISGNAGNANRVGRTMAYQHSGSGWLGTGPSFGTPSRAGAVITIPVNANGSTAYSVLSGVDGTTAGTASALTAWQVSTSNTFGSTLTITSAVWDGTNVVITLSADPGTTVYIRNYYGKNPDTTSWLFGTYSDTLKIGAMPILDYLTAT